MPKPQTRHDATAPDLTAEQLTVIERDDFEILPGATLRANELDGLAAEALDGYRMGDRERYDSRGRLWTFYREVANNQFFLAVRVSLRGLMLAEGAVSLDRIAGTEGEEQITALTVALATRAAEVQDVAAVRQAELRAEVAKVQHPGVEPPWPIPPEPAAVPLPEPPVSEAVAEAEAAVVEPEPEPEPARKSPLWGKSADADAGS